MLKYIVNVDGNINAEIYINCKRRYYRIKVGSRNIHDLLVLYNKLSMHLDEICYMLMDIY